MEYLFISLPLLPSHSGSPGLASLRILGYALLLVVQQFVRNGISWRALLQYLLVLVLYEIPENRYTAMECVKEGDLTKHIGSPLQQETVQNILKQTLEGLKVMHPRGIDHREIKPALCLLPPNTSLDHVASQIYWQIHTTFVVSMSPPVLIKLGDFGIVKWVRA